jgi:hypothetical protein
MTGQGTGSSTRDQTRSEAQKRLERFGSEWFLLEHPELEGGLWEEVRKVVAARPDLGNGLEEAAVDVLQEIQRALHRLESPIEFQVARSLTRDRYWAITALIHLGGQKQAKERLLRITSGRPLAVCMGDVYRIGARDTSRRGKRAERGRTVKTLVGDVSHVVKGCRAIFVDTDRANGGDMWPGLCRGCGKLKPQLKQDRALARRINAVALGKGATVYTGSAVAELERLEASGELAELVNRVARQPPVT